MLLIDYFDDLERDVCRKINGLSRAPVVREFFAAVSKLGDYSAYVILGLVCAADERVHGPTLLAQSVITAAVGVAVYKLLKERLVRERPFIRHGDIVCRTAPLDRYSFPSGHTLHAVSFAILFGNALPELLWILLPFVILVGASRVILGLHYPSDVAVGALLGASLALLSEWCAQALGYSVWA
tara:strand:+ start:3316 stop:3864 length:549 start_codon:yes stop_codon:yes gene_type:complete